MKHTVKKEQVKEFASLWHEIFSSGKLDVCTGKLAGVTPIEIKILRIIKENPEVILREICQKLNIVNSTLTSAVNRLEKRRFVERVISNRDLRSFGLKLTEEGKEALEEHLRGEEEILSHILDTLNDEERDNFIKMFKKIVENIV